MSECKKCEALESQLKDKDARIAEQQKEIAELEKRKNVADDYAQMMEEMRDKCLKEIQQLTAQVEKLKGELNG